MRSRFAPDIAINAVSKERHAFIALLFTGGDGERQN